MTSTTSGLSGLVDALTRLDAAHLDPAVVTQLLSEAAVSEEDLAPHVRFRADKYARNTVHRDGDFDVLVLCWEPGQETRVHDHSGQHGWVRVLRGAIEEVAYELAPTNEVEVPPGASLAACRLREAGRTLVPAGPAVAAVDRERAIHCLRNPEERGERTVTLHVYSRPHDTCMAYDLERKTSERLVLTSESQPG